jgi:hypothetical protein
MIVKRHKKSVKNIKAKFLLTPRCQFLHTRKRSNENGLFVYKQRLECVDQAAKTKIN